MNIIWKDRVRQVVDVGGTGDIVLGIADATCQALDAGDQAGLIFYLIMNKNGQWETGSGYYVHTASSFQRVTIYDSTAGGAAIDVIAGAKFVLTENSGSFRQAQNVLTYNVLAIDTAPFNTDTVHATSTKWVVTVETTDGTKTRMFEVSALKRPSGTPAFTVYSDLGDRLDIPVNVISLSNDLTLQLINNCSEDIAINVARVQTI